MVDKAQVLEIGKNLITTLQDLQSRGYKNIIHVAGDDRVGEFQQIVERYNNKPDKVGNIPFSFDTYKVVSSGERDPDSEGIEGVSASKVRKLALDNNYTGFTESMSTSIPDELKQEIFTKIKERIK